MYPQRVPCQAPTTSGLVTCTALNTRGSTHHLSSISLYVDVFGGTLVLHIGVHTSHILLSSAAVVVYSFFTFEHIICFILCFISVWFYQPPFFPVFILMLCLLQAPSTYIHTINCSMCCTVFVYEMTVPSALFLLDVDWYLTIVCFIFSKS
jgi:hypothetical protein